LFTFVFSWKAVPETSGKSLEEIEAIWAEKGESDANDIAVSWVL
jgi:hypothetical protein